MAVGDYVTAQGLKIPTVEELKTKCETDQRADMDPSIDTDADQPIGQLNGIFCSHLREAYEVLQIAFDGFDPDASEDSQLDSLAALTGTGREPSTKSKFVKSRHIVLTIDANKTIPKETVFHVIGDPTVRFVLLADVVSTTAGDYPGEAECTEYGPIPCNANTLRVIATPVVGLTAVNNPLDVELGLAEDSNTDLRKRREAELRATGSATVDSLRSDILAIKFDDGTKPVQTCTVFQNDQIDVDPDTGNPPKSLECLVYDGLTADCPDDTIAQTIWNGKPGGIQLVGNTSGSAVDGTGKTRTVPFSRPTIREVKFKLSLLVDPTTYPGDQACKDAVSARFKAKVHPHALIRFGDYIKALIDVGVLNVTSIQIAFVSDAYPAAFTNLQLGLREIGDADTSNIEIITTPGDP